MSKLSLYNIRVPMSEKSDLLYNSVSDKFIAIRHEVDLRDISVITPTIFSLLQENGMIVPSNLNEREKVIEIWNSNTLSSDSFTFIINPTLRCNFNCWYCYENHRNAPIMNNDILERTKALIGQTIERTNLIKLSFFGGEPLLEFSRIVKPLIEYTENAVSKVNKDIQISFTTNGFLLTPSMIDFLSQHYVKFMQITLDGGKQTHNKTRISKGKDSFDTITSNIESLLNKGISVTLRINVTPANISECKDITSWIKGLSDDCKKFLSVNIQQVWQTSEEADITGQMDILMDSICALGVYAYPAILDNLRNMCYADKANTIVINSDGRIFKCTAINFEAEKSESNITSTTIEDDLKQKFQIGQQKRFSNQNCISCPIFPLCLGGCSRSVLNNSDNDYCIYHNCPEKKEQLVMTIIKDRIRRNTFYKQS